MLEWTKTKHEGNDVLRARLPDQENLSIVAMHNPEKDPGTFIVELRSYTNDRFCYERLARGFLSNVNEETIKVLAFPVIVSGISNTIEELNKALKMIHQTGIEELKEMLSQEKDADKKDEG